MQQIYLSRGARAPELWTHAAVFDGTAVAWREEWGDERKAGFGWERQRENYSCEVNTPRASVSVDLNVIAYN